MPSPSYYPPIVSLGILILAVGVLLKGIPGVGLAGSITVMLLGAATILFGIYGWALEPE